MHARVSTYQLEPAGVDKASEQVENAFDQLDEMKRGVFLVDRTSGKGMTVTFWENEEALVSSRQAADRVRGAAMEALGGSIESVEEYEVLLDR